jgi:hypothetical protein
MAPSLFQVRLISGVVLVLERCVGLEAARFVLTVLCQVFGEAW